MKRILHQRIELLKRPRTRLDRAKTAFAYLSYNNPGAEWLPPAIPHMSFSSDSFIRPLCMANLT